MNYLINKKSFTPTAVSVFLLNGAVFATIAILLFRNTPYFWYFLGHFEFLWGFVWFNGFVTPAKLIAEKEKFVGTGYSAYSRVVLKTFILSIIICLCGALLQYFFPEKNIYLTTFCLQLAVFFLFFFMVHLIISGMQMQNSDIQEIPDNIASPEQIVSSVILCAKLANDADASLKFKRLAEKISHSLPTHGKISSTEEYTALIQQVNVLIDKFNSNSITDLNNEIIMLDFQIEKVKNACKR